MDLDLRIYILLSESLYMYFSLVVWEFVCDNDRNRIDLDMIYLIFSLLHWLATKKAQKEHQQKKKEKGRDTWDTTAQEGKRDCLSQIRVNGDPSHSEALADQMDCKT